MDTVATGSIVRAKEIKADSVHARIVYAKEIWADVGQIQLPHEGSDDKAWDVPDPTELIQQAEIVADVIYVRELRCKRIDVVEAYAKAIHLAEKP